MLHDQSKPFRGVDSLSASSTSRTSGALWGGDPRRRGVRLGALYPNFRWVRQASSPICETQGLPHGPHGTIPDEYPVYSNSRSYNMRGWEPAGG